MECCSRRDWKNRKRMFHISLMIPNAPINNHSDLDFAADFTAPELQRVSACKANKESLTMWSFLKSEERAKIPQTQVKRHWTGFNELWWCLPMVALLQTDHDGCPSFSFQLFSTSGKKRPKKSAIWLEMLNKCFIQLSALWKSFIHFHHACPNLCISLEAHRDFLVYIQIKPGWIYSRDQ